MSGPKVGIVGTRLKSPELWKTVNAVVMKLPKETIVVTGDCATGVDYFVREIAVELGYQLVVFHAAGRWRVVGKRAGPERNKNLVDYVDRLIGIPGPKSVGTWGALTLAESAGKPTEVVVCAGLVEPGGSCLRCGGGGTTASDAITPWKSNPCTRCDGSGQEPATS